MKLKREKISGYILLIMIFLGYSYLISDGSFALYYRNSLYINLIASIVSLILLEKLRKFDVMYITIFLIYILGSIILTQGGAGSAITFLTPLIWLFVIEQTEISFKLVKYIRWVSFITVAVVYYHSLKYAGVNIYWANTNINPNTMAMISLYACCLFIVFCTSERKIALVECTTCCILEVFIMINCSSRMSLIALVAFLFFSVIPMKMLSGNKIKGVFLILIVIGTLTPYAYLSLYHYNANLAILGKSLFTGREVIWLNMFNLMNEKPLSYFWGLGSRVNIWDSALNIHNNFFNIIVNFGFIGYALYFAFLFLKLSCICDKGMLKIQQKLISMFFANVLVYGFTETTSLWAFSFVFAYLSMGLALNKNFNIMMENEIKKANRKKI